MTYNLVKLVGVLLLAVFVIVAIGLGWMEAERGAVFVATLIGYVVGNTSVTNISPIIKKES